MRGKERGRKMMKDWEKQTHTWLQSVKQWGNEWGLLRWKQ